MVLFVNWVVFISTAFGINHDVHPNRTFNNIRADIISHRDTSKTKFKVLDFLYHISGKKTIAGIHNREPNASPAVWTNKIFATTGKYPGLWSGDFLFQPENIDHRQTMISEAVAEWKKGSLVNIMWHACNPALSQPCGFDSAGVLSHLSDTQWRELLKPGTVINGRWRAMMDEICGYLQQLKDQQVEVLWRPLHEMNQRLFWWGGRPGRNGTLQLYRLMHDYMTKTKHLTNLIWVWDLQDFGSLSTDVVAYNPGKKYWDLAALDVYDGNGYTQSKYDIMKDAAGSRPMAIGECSRLPTADQLMKQPKWVFFMSWSELTFESNSNTELINLYTSPNVITLNQMPGW